MPLADSVFIFGLSFLYGLQAKAAFALLARVSPVVGLKVPSYGKGHGNRL